MWVWIAGTAATALAYWVWTLVTEPSAASTTERAKMDGPDPASTAASKMSPPVVPPSKMSPPVVPPSAMSKPGPTKISPPSGPPVNQFRAATCGLLVSDWKDTDTWTSIHFPPALPVLDRLILMHGVSNTHAWWPPAAQRVWCAYDLGA